MPRRGAPAAAGGAGGALSAVDHDAVEGPQQAPQSPRDVGQAGEAMGHRLAGLAARLLRGGDRPPARVDELDGVALELHGRRLEVLRPQAEARRPRQLRVVGDHVDLGVVEERVVVQVGRADREPVVVDDAHLGVHVDRRRRGAGAARVERGGQQALAAAVGGGQHAELPLGVVFAAVRPGRQQQDQAKVGRRRVCELVAQGGDDLGGPEELVLQVDEAPRAANGAQVRLENAKAAVGGAGVATLRDRGHKLRLDVAGGRGVDDGQALAGHLAPAQGQVGGHVAHYGAVQLAGHVVPAAHPAVGVLGGVEAVERVVGQVDAAHEGDLTVDHDDLFVVGVQRTLAVVERHADVRVGGELRDVPPGRSAARVERRAAAPPPTAARARADARRARRARRAARRGARSASGQSRE